MKRILGIKFRDYGQIYFFYCTDPAIEPGDTVIAETGQGIGLGNVVAVRDTLPDGLNPEGMRDIVRKAGPEDQEALDENALLTKNAFTYCTQCIRDRELNMKLVDVEILYDKSKFIFYFTAPMRIDFRELVKDLVREYHARIELRQIGVRHETQMIGAVGNCGMTCCCRRFLRKFAPVTIKMAKEQNLFLNPAKISGICGRLLCCLSYEQESYEHFHRECPRLGKKYQTSRGPLRVLRSNMFRNSIVALTEEGEELELNLEEWRALEPKRPEQPPQGEQKNQPRQQMNHDLMVYSLDPDSLDTDDDELFFGLEGLEDKENSQYEGGRQAQGERKSPPKTGRGKPGKPHGTPSEQGAQRHLKKKKRPQEGSKPAASAEETPNT